MEISCVSADKGPAKPAPEKLKHLKQMYDEGLITEEEYEAKKRKYWPACRAGGWRDRLWNSLYLL